MDDEIIKNWSCHRNSDVPFFLLPRLRRAHPHWFGHPDNLTEAEDLGTPKQQIPGFDSRTEIGHSETYCLAKITWSHECPIVNIPPENIPDGRSPIFGDRFLRINSKSVGLRRPTADDPCTSRSSELPTGPCPQASTSRRYH